jgi:hypothetical protein
MLYNIILYSMPSPIQEVIRRRVIEQCLSIQKYSSLHLRYHTRKHRQQTVSLQGL